LRRLLLTILLAVAASAVGPGTASAATPCWKQVINDWLADGRIDRIYEDACYAKALEELPQDLREYSALADEIELARAAAQRGQLPPRRSTPGGGGAEGDERTIPGTPFSNPGGGDGERNRGAFRSLLVKVGPKNADEVPIPLLVLGAIATLLMATGAAGMVARRTSGRRIQPDPQP
jgi:hypothetical protein